MDKNTRQFILDKMRALVTPERPVFLVGGAVRDLLLNRPVHDLDFVMSGETRRFSREVARRLDGALYALDGERGTFRIILEQGEKPGEQDKRFLLDFSTLRGNNLEEDLRARDFTINAMAVDISRPDHLIDTTGGMTDLREKRVRSCAPESMSSDPIRVLRAVRQAVQLGFQITPDTLQQVRSAVFLLQNSSAERVRDELFRIFDGPQVSLAIRLLDRLNILAYVLPELESLKGVNQSAPHQYDVWEHTLQVVYYLEQTLAPLVGQYHEETVGDLTTGSAVLWLGRYRDFFQKHFLERLVVDRTLRGLLFLAALYHDISKPETSTLESNGRVRFLHHQEKGVAVTRKRGRGLALSVHEIDRLSTLVRHHMRVHFLANSLQTDGKPPSRQAIFRFFRDSGSAGVDICLHSLADTRGTYGAALSQKVWEAELDVCRHLLEGYWERKEEVVSPPALLSGSEIIRDYNLKPGKIIGQILGMIREEQAMGNITNREDAQASIRDWLKNHPGQIE